VVASGVHVSTPEAYTLLGRAPATALTSQTESPILREFQTVACGLGIRDLDQLPLKNDFEKAVFRQHPELARLAARLRGSGAKPALMTGSGSAVFGVFSSFSKARSAAAGFAAGTAFPVRFISRRRYRELWRRALGTAAGRSFFAAIN
jgi:4-diphosphocytidyl-2-C-methyl-D-erythritol kinase